MKIQTLHEDPSLRVVKAGRVLFALWRAVPRLEHVHHLARACERHRDGIGGTGQIMVNVIFDGIPNFSDEVRTELAAFSKHAASWEPPSRT